MFRRPLKVAVPFANEEAAATERLKSVTARGKGEESLYPVLEEQPRSATIRRLFWNPDELAGVPQ